MAVAALACVLVSCSSGGGSQSGNSTGAAAGPKKGGSAAGKVIGISIQDLEAQFYQQMEAGMQSEAKKYGYHLLFVDANRDSARQQSQVEDFISKKVDAIVLTPYDSQAIGSAIAEANNANIPVFTADIASTSKQGKVVSHVASDNVQGGEQAASLMCKAIGGSGEVAILDEPEVTSVQDRVKGFKLGLAQHCPRAKVVAEVDSGGTRDKANSDMGDILQAHKNLKGVFGINDDSALGAVAAIRAAGLSGIAVIGYDATPEARTAIANGQIYGDAVQHPDVIGRDVIQIVHDYFAGKSVPPKVNVPVGIYTKTSTK
ncbi:MAG TPA: substrate-binding domain-containing protein [Candidatus Baltobacteraceae bacterium]|jgi:ribose transport system substrate-binding protein|nr:substrate-binding domain-containing protein [Candidatus Baltobacteraceae bacterium]